MISESVFRTGDNNAEGSVSVVLKVNQTVN